MLPIHSSALERADKVEMMYVLAKFAINGERELVRAWFDGLRERAHLQPKGPLPIRILDRVDLLGSFVHLSPIETTRRVASLVPASKGPKSLDAALERRRSKSVATTEFDDLSFDD